MVLGYQGHSSLIFSPVLLVVRSLAVQVSIIDSILLISKVPVRHHEGEEDGDDTESSSSDDHDLHGIIVSCVKEGTISINQIVLLL